MINLEMISQYIGWAMVIITFSGLVVNPIVRKFTQLSDNLVDIRTTLKLINKDLDSINTNWIRINRELEEQRRVIDEHSKRLERYDEKFNGLLKEDY